MAHTFKVGDEVIVKNIEAGARGRSVCFTIEMAKLVGQKVVVDHICHDGLAQRYLRCTAPGGECWAYELDWVEPLMDRTEDLAIMLEKAMGVIELCEEAGDVPELTDLPEVVQAWWTERKKHIRARLEKLREQALAKLTEEEREVLGV